MINSMNDEEEDSFDSWVVKSASLCTKEGSFYKRTELIQSL